MKKKILLLVIFAFLGAKALIFIVRNHNRRVLYELQQRTQKEIDSLYSARAVLLRKYIPDSVRAIAYDASYELNYVEYDSNDYWEFRHQLDEVREYIHAHCPECAEIDQLIEEKEEKLKNN